MDSSAHGVVSTHEIFKKPYPVQLEWEATPTPKHYRKYYNGRDLGPTMKTWRVQKSGYMTDESVEPGVVASWWGYTDAPDGEFIAGGINTKGPKYPSLGRHASFFQWGFSAAPGGMTESGRRAFVNAICYIARFDRQTPLTRKVGMMGLFTHRGWALDRSLDLVHSGEAYKLLEQHYERLRQDRASAVVKKAKGEKLTDAETRAIGFPPDLKVMPWERYKQLQTRSYPDSLKKELGTADADFPKYYPYYKKNIEYLRVVGGKYEVDADVKAWGVSNRKVATLEKAVALLENGADTERALRVLRRYTDQSFTAAADWRKWLDANKASLFFSDLSGFKFVSSERDPKADRTAIEKLRGKKPTEDAPVVCEAYLLGTAKAGATVSVGIRFRILAGWHIYAAVPAKSPYPLTRVKLETPKGVTAIDDWDRPMGMPSLETAGLATWDDKVVLLRKLKLGKDFAGGKLVVQASWQACDEHRCNPPDTARCIVELR